MNLSTVGPLVAAMIGAGTATAVPPSPAISCPSPDRPVGFEAYIGTRGFSFLERHADALGRAVSEQYTLDGRIYHASMSYGAGGCTRMIVLVDPMVLGIATVATSVKSGFVVEPGEPGPVIFRDAQSPDTANITVQVYLDGEPVADADVTLSADWRGAPPLGLGRTIAHEHLYYAGATPSTSLRLEGKSASVVQRTDHDGVARSWVVPGFRGGVESIRAQVTVKNALGADTVMAAASPVVMRIMPAFITFADAVLGPGAVTPEPGEAFPFRLVGNTREHIFNYWTSGSEGRRIAALLRNVLLQDRIRLRQENRKNVDSRWIQINDISLEYGGQFKLNGQPTCNSPSNDNSHKTHHLGIDFDVSPCYTRSDGTRIDAGTCYSGRNDYNNPEIVHISRSLLMNEIVAKGCGAVFVHSPDTDGSPYHYHIRFNLQGACAWAR